MAIADRVQQPLGRRRFQPGVDEVIGLVFAARTVLDVHIAAEEGRRPLDRFTLKAHRIVVALQIDDTVIPRPRHVHGARCHQLGLFGRVGPIGRDVDMRLAQPGGGGGELFVGHFGPVGDPGRQIGQRPDIVRTVGQRRAVLVFRVGEHAQAGHVLGRDGLGVVGDGGRAPVRRNEPHALVVAEHFAVQKTLLDLVEVRNTRRVPRLDQASIAVLSDHLAAGVNQVRLEPRRDLLERLVVIAVEGIGRAVAMRVDIGLEDRGFLEPGPIENRQFGIGGIGGQGRRGQDGGGQQAHENWPLCCRICDNAKAGRGRAQGFRAPMMGRVPSASATRRRRGSSRRSDSRSGR